MLESRINIPKLELYDSNAILLPPPFYIAHYAIYYGLTKLVPVFFIYLCHIALPFNALSITIIGLLAEDTTSVELEDPPSIIQLFELS